MWALIKKDLRISRTYFFLFIVFLFLDLLTQNYEYNTTYSCYVLLPIASVTFYDNYYNQDLLCFSLPIKKIDYVISKYISAIIIFLLETILYIIFYKITTIFFVFNTFTYEKIIFSFLSVIIIESIVLPIYFIGIHYFLLVFIAILIPFAFNIVVNLLDRYYINITLDNFIISTIGIIILLILSILLALKIFKNREF